MIYLKAPHLREGFIIGFALLKSKPVRNEKGEEKP